MGGVKRDFALVGHGHELGDLDDINITSPADDSLLQYNSSTGEWEDTPLSGIDHDALLNFVADEHIAHSGVTLTAGAGLTGGGTIAASRTFDVGAGTGITVNANDVQVNLGHTFEWTATHGWSDNAEIQLGTGNDLRLFHDGSTSTIRNDTGALEVRAGASNLALSIATNGRVTFQAGAGTSAIFGTGSSDQFTVLDGGASSLRFNIFRTGGVNRWIWGANSDTETGAGNAGSNLEFWRYTDAGSFNAIVLTLLRANGFVQMPNDSQELQLGASQDLRLYHNGTDSFIDNDTAALIYTSAGGHAVGGAFTSPISTVLGNIGDGVMMLRSATQPNFFAVEDDAAADEKVWRQAWSGGDWFIQGVSDAGVSTTFVRLVRTGVTGANLTLPVDNEEIQLGAGPDLRFYHNGTNSIIRNDTGELQFLIGASATASIATSGIWNFFGNATAAIFGDGTGAPLIHINGASGQFRGMLMRTNGATRWGFLENSTAESGSDVGSDFVIRRYNDAGTAIGNSIELTRSNGFLSMPADNVEFRLGLSNDLRFYHDGTHSYIRNDTGRLILSAAAVEGLRVNTNGSMTFSAGLAAGSDAWEFASTTARGVGAPYFYVKNPSAGVMSMYAYDGTSTTVGTLRMDFAVARLAQDNAEFQLGAGPDLRLYHDGTNSIVRTDTGGLRLQFSTNNRIECNTTGVGFNGATPIARPDYTITNPTTNRSIDVSGITHANLAQVVGTMIQDLINYGLYQ